jgi:hypothetical protein
MKLFINCFDDLLLVEGENERIIDYQRKYKS